MATNLYRAVLDDPTTLQNAAAATGAGTPLNVRGFDTAIVLVTISNTATVTFEGSLDNGTTWTSVEAANVATDAVGTTTSATGLFMLPIGGLELIRTRISAYTSGTVTTLARGIEGDIAAALTASGSIAGTVTANQGNAGGTPWPVDTELNAAAAINNGTRSLPTTADVAAWPHLLNSAQTGGSLQGAAGTFTDGHTGYAAAMVSPWAFNGSNFDRVRSGSAANIAANSGVGSQITTKPGNWAAKSAPATNTQATASQAAGGAGVRHVCTAVSFTFAAGASAVAAAAPMTVNLRDGATGAGTVLMSWYINIPAVAGESRTITLTDLNVEGSAATAMTLEFAAAGGTNSYESVTMTGYDVS